MLPDRALTRAKSQPPTMRKPWEQSRARIAAYTLACERCNPLQTKECRLSLILTAGYLVDPKAANDVPRSLHGQYGELAQQLIKRHRVEIRGLQSVARLPMKSDSQTRQQSGQFQ